MGPTVEDAECLLTSVQGAESQRDTKIHGLGYALMQQVGNKRDGKAFQEIL